MNSILLASVLIGVLAAVVFGLLARHFHRGPVVWAVSAGVGALLVTAICMGLANAVTLPYSDAQRASNLVKGALIAAALIALFAGGVAFGTDWQERRIRA